MRSYRLLTLVFTLIVLLAMPCTLAVAQGNLLENPGFEELDSDGMPVGWYTEAYLTQKGYTSYDVSQEAFSGDYSAVINNFDLNDARYAQTVEVEPSSLYLFSGWIKIDNMTDSGRGANLSVKDLYVFSESVHEADDQWHYVELYGETGEDQHEVTVFARVGGYSGESQGKAYFDNLSLKKVDSVPGDGIASLWFKDSTPVTIDPIEKDTPAAGPIWPWLIVISALYMAVAVWMVSYVTLDQRELTDQRKVSPGFLLALAAALASRLVLAQLVEGYQVDVNCFRSWGHTMASVGPALFYQSTSFCDYTPAYIYVMGFADWLGSLGNTLGLALTEAFYHKLVPILCDVLSAVIVYTLARNEKFSRKQAEIVGVFVAFNPAMFLNSALWCQIDSVLCLGLLVVAVLAVQRKWTALLPVYVLCALIKPQALMLGPLGLLVVIMEWIRHREMTGQFLKGLGISAILAALIIVPFGLNQPVGWLIEKYGSTLASYPYATVNTANFYYLFGANWAGIEQSAGWLPAVCLFALTAGWGFVLVQRQKDERLRIAQIVRSFCMALVKPFAIAADTILVVLRVKRQITARFNEHELMFCFSWAYAVMAALQVSWAVLGFTTMALAFAVILPMYFRSGNVRHVPLLGAVLFIILYVFGIKMHERYLFPALVLLAAAFVLHRNRRILGLLAVLTCTVFINEGIVLDNSIRLGASMGHLNADTNWLAMLLSLINVLCALAAVWTAYRICVENEPEQLDDDFRLVFPAKIFDKRPRSLENYRPDHTLHWKPIDWVLMLTVTCIYSVVCLCNLGSTRAPQQPWISTSYDESVVIDLGANHDDFTMLYYAQVSNRDFTVATSPDGDAWSEEYWAEMNQGQCFRWKYLVPASESAGGTRSYPSAFDLEDVRHLSGRYVRITAQQINLTLNEVIFRDAQGERIPATVVEALNANTESPLLSAPECLLDEQETLEGEPGWYNSTYFDEIYHARTAFEHLNGTQPYETSHPPLGKVIMSWFVGIFGMTPFGWRFAGALMGILMLPAMYVLGKQLTKRTDMAFAAMTMMALDCMHYTQTRIATIDSFPVFFIILSYLFMLRFMQRDIVIQPIRQVLPDLALSGFFMGCSVASKWIGAYAGVGLALLYFWTCLRHINLSAERGDSHTAWKRVVFLCLWCLLFFVAIPLAIYLLSYIPYFAYTHIEGIGDFLERVWTSNFGDPVYSMFAYHSQPGHGMDHPFYSPWYEWPLIKRPMYYSMGTFIPEGYESSIFCFGNPAVWLAGLAGLAAAFVTWAKRHYYVLTGSGSILHTRSSSWSVVPAFILIGFLSQYLPWVLVPRGTYIYHYFASIPFLILGTMMLLHWLSLWKPRIGRIVLMAYLLLCLIFFIAYYPYASGVAAPQWWMDLMKKFLRIYYI